MATVGALVRVCALCGSSFTADGYGKGMRKYCGKDCSKRARYLRQMERNHERALHLRNVARQRRAALVERGLPYRDPEYQRDYDLRRKYGMTVAEYDALSAEQEGLCAICGQSCPSGKRLAVDHDHFTGRVRGLLCANCNRAIGLLSDDPQRAQRAAEYLRGS